MKQFTDEEIQEMEAGVLSFNFGMMSSPLWRRAFRYYNIHNTRKLGMTCRSCYAKVLQYVKEANKMFDIKLT